MKTSDIQALRQQYASEVLREEALGPDPHVLFDQWFDEAVRAELLEPNAMALATIDAGHRPQVRTVLYKGRTDDQGYTFYSNYESDKGHQLQLNPFASVLFMWLPLARQIRISGRVIRLTKEASRHYFELRPLGSRIGAIASNQSRIIESRELLDQAFQEASNAVDEDHPPQMPEHWGGYQILADRFEFWQGHANRLHDRIVFEWDGEQWQKYRLAP